jgi:adhesin transport system outer membrane protein
MRVSVATLSVVCCTATSLVFFGTAAYSKDGFTISDAIRQAVQTNPAVGEAAASRRASDAELQQSKGVLLPQVRLEVRAGPEKLDRAITPPPAGNDDYQHGREGSVVIRQLLFDGLSSINQIWMQAARLDAASSRVLERTELIALDAAEAYIDVMRYTRLVALANDNLAAHKRILRNVRARFSGGRAGEGDLQQAIEREQSAEATLADYRQRLSDARAAYRKAVGIEAYNLRFPNRLPGLPATKDASLAIALKFNPTIRAAGYDAKAARYNFDSTAGDFVPKVYLEGRALRGWDSITYDGRRDEVSGKVVMSWDIFNGGQDSWKRAGAAERMTEQTMKHARLQRDAFETLDKAWAARTITSDRVAALSRELDASRKVVTAYTKEYEIGQRTLVDLLNAENQQFNTAASLVSARGVAVFADYQLLAVMGQLLNYMKTPQPKEAITNGESSGFFPPKLAPIYLRAPVIGPEPINLQDGTAPANRTRAAQSQTGTTTFASRFWPSEATAGNANAAPPSVGEKTALVGDANGRLLSDNRLSFAAPQTNKGNMTSVMFLNMPMWPARSSQAD